MAHLAASRQVQGAAEEALPVLCACVENAEVGKTLKEVLMLALRRPDTTLECIDEVLLTTFCNPMDGAPRTLSDCTLRMSGLRAVSRDSAVHVSQGRALRS